MRRSQSAADEAILSLPGLFSPDAEQFPGEVQPGDVAQAAHEPRLPDAERSPGEPQAEQQPFDWGRPAYGLAYSRLSWSELPVLYSQ
jgi:hypothetical protein